MDKQERIEYLYKKRLQVLEEIKPICDAFKIDKYDYLVEDCKERLKINDQLIGCDSNSIYAIKQELIGYIFVCYFKERSLGAFKKQTFNQIKGYWI